MVRVKKPDDIQPKVPLEPDDVHERAMKNLSLSATQIVVGPIASLTFKIFGSAKT